MDSSGKAHRRGFTLLEVLIAMALMALVMVGVLPLFARSMSNNVESDQLTEVTNRARRRMEELRALPIDAADLAVPPGARVRRTTHLFSAERGRWIGEADFPADDVATFTRVTVVRLFSVSALALDAELSEDEALDGSAPSRDVHLKEIVVRVNSGRPTFLNLLGRGKAVTLHLLRSV